MYVGELNMPAFGGSPPSTAAQNATSSQKPAAPTAYRLRFSEDAGEHIAHGESPACTMRIIYIYIYTMYILYDLLLFDTHNRPARKLILKNAPTRLASVTLSF